MPAGGRSAAPGGALAITGGHGQGAGQGHQQLQGQMQSALEKIRGEDNVQRVQQGGGHEQPQLQQQQPPVNPQAFMGEMQAVSLSYGILPFAGNKGPQQNVSFLR